MRISKCVVIAGMVLATASAQTKLARADYLDRVHAAWLGQIIGTLIGFQFEHKAASAVTVSKLPERYQLAPLDDDYYYELVALRAFEKHGTKLTVAQLGEQWVENNAGTWGSSEQARLLLARGIKPPDTGHPRYNKLWFTIGAQFSSDIYGLVAPGMPNTAARLARDLGHINGYGEGADGAVFVAGLHSVAFFENNPKEAVRKAARLIHPSSAYRQCLDLVIAMADRGASPQEVMRAVEDRWHIEYPATNNAVANGGIIAASLWFGEGDFLKTVNFAFAAADYTDADCNAANAGGVVGTMRGTRAIPPELIAQLRDRLEGADLGKLPATPAVKESIADIARRTARIGARFVLENGGSDRGDALLIRPQTAEAQPAEVFPLSRLTEYWDPQWELQRAGFGAGLRGLTHLDGEVLATYPRDEVRGAVLTRQITLGAKPVMALEVGSDSGRCWRLDIHVDNELVESKVIEGGQGKRAWHTLEVNLSAFANKPVTVRLIQRVLLGPEKAPGNAYWRRIAFR